MRRRGRLLLGTAGDGADWEDLRDFLSEARWQVEHFEACPYGDTGDPEGYLPNLDGEALAILVIARSKSLVDPVEARRIVHLIGRLQGALGVGRVVVLQEAEVDPFLLGTGVTELRYEEGNIRSRFAELGSQLGDEALAVTRRTTPWLERFGIGEGTAGPESWLVMAALTLSGAVLIAVSILAIGPSEGGDDDGEMASTTPTVGSQAEPASPSTAAAGSVVDGGAAGVGAELGSVNGLPARCVLGTARDTVLPQIQTCDGVGGVRIDGYLGPWHADISAVSMDLGVVGYVSMESRAAVSQTGGRVPLQAGIEESLEPYDPQFGVTELVFEFSANGQRVQIHRSNGDDAVVVFGLDL